MARVLVVDDRPDILLAARLHLRRAGHEVLLAADGEHALARLGAGAFDLVVLDPWMPTSESQSVLAAARRGRVLVISAQPPSAEDAAGYLPKPFTPEALVAAATAALARAAERPKAQ